MKKIITLAALLISAISFSQVGIGTVTPHASSILDVTSTTKGFLPPRMTSAQKNDIASPAAGLIVYCTDCVTNGEIQVYDGTVWKAFINLTGMVTSVGNTATVVTNANLTGDVTSSGNATTLSNTAVTVGTYGSATTVPVVTVDSKGRVTGVTNTAITAPSTFTGNLAGDVTGAQGTTTVGKINGTALSGLTTGLLKNTTTTGVPSIAVAGTDYLLPNGSGAALTGITSTTNANLTGEVTSIGNATTVTNAAVIGKVLTGFISGSGTVAATDNVLQSVQKLDGNIALKATLASPTFTGTPTLPTGTIGVTQTAGNNTTALATTAFVIAATSVNIPLAPAEVVLPTKIDGAQLYAVKGSFTASGTSTNISITKPTGMTGYYTMVTYIGGKTFRKEIFSFDTGATTNNVITGTGPYAEVYPAGTYNYVLEYFK